MNQDSSMSTLNEFLTVSNLKILLSHIMSYSKSNNVQIPLHKIKLILVDVMNTIREDDRIKNLTLSDINKKTINICNKIIQDTKSNLPVKSVIPMATTTSEDKKNVSLEMDKITKDRDETSKTNTVTDNITEHSKQINDEAFDEKHFLKTLDEIQKNRDDFNSKLNNIQPKQTIDFQNIESFTNNTNIDVVELDNPINVIAIKNDNDNTNVDKICSNIDESNSFQRTLDTTIQQSSELSLHPKIFYQENSTINDVMNSKVMLKSGGPEHDITKAYLDSYKQSIKTKKINKTHYILINSYDRNWINDKNRYQYNINFTNAEHNIQQIPYYQNNKTIPFTKTTNFDGIDNTMGWIDKFDIQHDPYDSALPDGDIVGYEDVNKIIDDDASLSKFKDIHSIKVSNVTIPIEVYFRHVNSINVNIAREHTFNFNFPYVLLNIDEFNDVYDGTDNTIRKCFCQLQYDNHFTCPNGRGYIILKPVQNESKLFSPTPLSTLSKMTISLTKPNGELLNYNIDGIKILAIQSIQTYYLKITTTTFFNRDSFMIGDFIRFQNYQIFKINSSLNDTYISQVNGFINRSEGHEIYQIGEPNNDGYYNSFNIFAPGSFNDHIGKFNVETTLVNTLTEFNDVISSKNIINDTSTYDNGYLLNMSLQNSISMVVETKIVDSSIVSGENV